MQRGLEEVVNVFVEKVALQNEGRKRDNLLAGWVLGREKQNNQKKKQKQVTETRPSTKALCSSTTSVKPRKKRMLRMGRKRT